VLSVMDRRPAWHSLICTVLLVIAAAVAGDAAAQGQGNAPAQTAPDDGIHLGVASCAGSTCHGAVKPAANSGVAQDEYLIWSQKDKHHQAYAVLSSELGLRIAHNLGLPDAKSAQICLDCHADNMPQDRRGREFDLADGVGCEACHGGAITWLGEHLSGAGHKANLAAGMYPTDQPLARAKLCLSCHFGDDRKFVTHQIMGAGHPPMTFELDTFTYIQPAHFAVNKSYIARKGRPNDVQIWAVGQAVDLAKRMDALTDPKHAPQGLDPELVLFDCQSCHHSMKDLQWQKRSSGGLGPGRLRLYDAGAVMLRVIAARVAPDAAKALSDHMMALHQATTKDWGEVQREGTAVREAANRLIPALAGHEFSRDDMKALADGVVEAGLNGDATEYSGAQQATMALSSIVTAMKTFGYAGDEQVKAMHAALGGLNDTLANDQAYDPNAFVKALRGFKGTLPQ
jgi:hypothetical protein